MASKMFLEFSQTSIIELFLRKQVAALYLTNTKKGASTLSFERLNENAI